MSTKKIAVIGCGAIAASQHIPAYIKNEKAEIKYFCDIVQTKASEMVEKYGCGIAVSDYREILNDPELDAVSVCVPNNLHAQITIDFLKAGNNVLCEKPAGRTYAEVELMQKAQRESGKVLNIGVVNRFNTAVNRIKDLIDSGELGEVYHVYGSFRSYRSIPGWGGWFTTKDVSGGGVLIDWGVHFIDLIMYCCGDPAPETVSGKTYCKLGRKLEEYTYIDMWAGPPKTDGIYDVDDFVTGFIRTSGPSVTINGAWAQNINATEMYIDFMGTKAGIRLMYGGNFKIFSAKDGALLEITPAYKVEQPFEKEVDAFLTCIDTGEKLPSHIDNIMVTAKIMQALYDSSEQNREIAVGS
jgi:predicted dehydrogenase